MRRRSILLVSVFVLSLFLLPACAGETAGGEPVTSDDVLNGSNWQLFAYRKTSPSPGVVITASFIDGELSGSGGCNHYSASYQLDGERISAGAIEITEMGCMQPEGVMADEAVYIEMLAAAHSYSLEGDRLYLYVGDHESLTFDRLN